MSDTPQQYILRRPVTARQRKDIPRGAFVIESFPDFYAVDDFRAMDMTALQPHQFEALFVPLDVQALREQVDKLSIRIAHDLQVEDISWDETRSIIEQHLYDEVLALFGLHNTEEQT